MQRWMYNIAGWCIIAGCMILPANIAGAVPQLPMVVSGTVYINGERAPVGTEVQAIIDGEVRGIYKVTKPGVYGMAVEYKQGSNIVDFYVNGIKSESMEWNSDPTTLDLSVTIPAKNQDRAETATGSSRPNGMIADATPVPEPNSTVIAKNTAVTENPVTTEPVTSAPATSELVTPEQTQEQVQQKQNIAKTPGLSSIVVFAVLLASKALIRRNK